MATAAVSTHGPAFRSAGEALAALSTSLDYLAGVNWLAEGGAGQGAALRELEGARSLFTVAHGEALLALDVSGGHSLDGQPTARTWMRHEARVTRFAAREQWNWVKFRGAHPVLWRGLRRRELSQSWAAQIGRWTDCLPEEEVKKADEILLEAVRSGLPLEPDIARLARLIWETIKSQRPDPDPDPGDDGHADRALRLGTTIGGAGRLTGDLSATCAALLAQVLTTFGKRTGDEDLRSADQRNHDAFEEALRLALGIPDNPEAAGLKSQGLVIIPLSDLMLIDGASALADAWVEAQLGQLGWLSGGQADGAFCTSVIDPVVTGSVNWDVISQMADVFLDAHGITSPADQADSDIGDLDDGDDPGVSCGTDGGAHGDSPSDAGKRPRCGCTCGKCACPAPAGRMSREGRLALERTLLAMAIEAVSGPGGLAAFLRTSLLDVPFSGQPLVLDYGMSKDIPDHIRRAVAMRDHHCQWPGGCDRPWWQCEPHHVIHRARGGRTSLQNLRMMCFFHHHVTIHREGWTYRVHPDGTSEATSPRGNVVRSHSPPGAPAP